MILSFEAFNLSGGQYKKLFGRTLGGFCDVIYADHISKDVKNYWAHTNISMPYGTCPFIAQVIEILDWVPGKNILNLVKIQK